MQKLEWCDLMLSQFPLWWLSLPAILKDWVDRVFRGKRAMVSITTGAAEEAYRNGGFNGDIHAILRSIQRGILQFVGFDVLAPNIVYAPLRLNDDERQKHLKSYAERLEHIHGKIPIDVGSF